MKFAIVTVLLSVTPVLVSFAQAGDLSGFTCRDVLPTLVALRDDTVPTSNKIIDAFEQDAQTLDTLTTWAIGVSSNRSGVQNADVNYVTAQTLLPELAGASVEFAIASRKERIDLLASLSGCVKPKNTSCSSISQKWAKYLLDYANGSTVTADLFTSISNAFQSINLWVKGAVGKTITATTAQGFEADSQAARSNEPSYRENAQKRVNSLNDIINQIPDCLN